MKRSHMVLKIAECLMEPHHEDPMLEADFILRKLEEKGMLPPKFYIDGIGEEPTDPSYYGLNGWEPET